MIGARIVRLLVLTGACLWCAPAEGATGRNAGQPETRAIRLVALGKREPITKFTDAPAHQPSFRSTAAPIDGPTLVGVVDARVWGGFIVVVGDGPTLYVVSHEGRLQDSVKIHVAGERITEQALSLLSTDSLLGVWLPESGLVAWVDGEWSLEQIRRTGLSRKGAYPGWKFPLQPLRLHDRAVVAEPGVLYTEVRPLDRQGEDAFTPAYLTRERGGAIDTVLSFSAPSYSVKRGAVRVCCRQPPLFAPQPLWGILPGGTIVFSPGDSPLMMFLSPTGQLRRTVLWDVGEPPLVRQEVEAYLSKHVARVFADSQPSFISRIRREAVRRAGRLLATSAKRLPVATQLIIDDDGRIWLRRFDRAAWPDGQSDIWDVLDSTGIVEQTIQVRGVDDVFDIRRGILVGVNRRAGRMATVKIVTTAAPIPTAPSEDP